MDNIEIKEQQKVNEQTEQEPVIEEIQQPVFDPASLPDFVPDEEKIAKLQQKGTVKPGLWGFLYLHGKTILNCIMVFCLFTIALGWFINSVVIAIASLIIIAICIVLNYTIVKL